MRPFRRDVDGVEEVVVHEIAVALVMVARQPDVLVEVEGGHPGEVQAFGSVQADELLVEPDGRGARCQPEHGVRLGADEVRDDFRRCGRHLGIVRTDHDFHGVLLASRDSLSLSDRTVCSIGRMPPGLTLSVSPKTGRGFEVESPPGTMQPRARLGSDRVAVRGVDGPPEGLGHAVGPGPRRVGDGPGRPVRQRPGAYLLGIPTPRRMGPPGSLLADGGGLAGARPVSRREKLL